MRYTNNNINEVNALNKNSWIKLGILAVVVGILFVTPPPSGLSITAWKLFAIFVAAVAGLIVKVMPEAPFMVIVISAGAAVVPLKDIMVGYANSVAWLICLALIMSVGFRKSGLAHRIGLILINKIGKSSMSVAYSLGILEILLATSTPSIPARTGALVYPLAEGVNDVCKSSPTENPKRIGSYMTLMLYMVSCVTSSLFMTGSGPSTFTAKLAGDMLGVNITWPLWALAAVPGYLGVLIIPWMIYKLYPPEISSLETVRETVAAELKAKGALTYNEKVTAGIFLAVLIAWATSTVTNIDATHVAFLGVALFLLSGVLQWKDIVESKDVWTTLMWFGAFIGLAAALEKYKFFLWLSASIKAALPAGGLSHTTGFILLAFLVTIPHYIFPSVVAYVTAFAPLAYSFIGAVGLPLYPACFLTAFLMCISASFTHYGNGVAPILFAKGFVDMKVWWGIGFLVTVVLTIVYLTVGLAYWKMIGLYY